MITLKFMINLKMSLSFVNLIDKKPLLEDL